MRLLATSSSATSATDKNIMKVKIDGETVVCEALGINRPHTFNNGAGEE